MLARYRDSERGRNIYERIPRQIAINTTPSSLPRLELADVADFTAGERFTPSVATSVDLGEEVDAP